MRRLAIAGLALTVLLQVAPLRGQGRTDLTALIGLARTARDSGRAAEAVRHFADADRRAPLTGGLLVEFFWAAHAARVPEARALGARVLSADPRQADVRDGMIGLAAAAGDERGVVALAEAGMAIEPAAARWVRRLGESGLRQGDGATAARAFARAAALVGGLVDDRAQHAVALEVAGDVGAALGVWATIDEAVVARRAEWVASRNRTRSAAAAKARRSVPAAPTEPVLPEDILRASTAALAKDPCGVAPLEALDRLADGTALVEAVGRRHASCPERSAWVSRAVERAIAAGRFNQALALVTPAAADPESSADLREQHGVLLQWTGAPTEAVAILAPLVRQYPQRVRAADALVDAYRSLGDPDRAWTIAASRSTDPAAPAERRLAAAALALETGRLQEALDMARAIEPAAGDLALDVRAVAAGALVAFGRASEAKATLQELHAHPAAALTWLEAVALDEGVGAALESAAKVDRAVAPEWAEFHARLAVWQTQLGLRDAATRRLESLAAANPERAMLARAEVSLAEGRPGDTATILRSALANGRERLREVAILSTALAELGQWDEAHQHLTTLLARRPHERRWQARAAEWRHRQSPGAATLAALEAAVKDAPAVADSRAALARAYLVAGQPGRAILALGSSPEGSASDHELSLTARALRAEGRSDDALAVLRRRSRPTRELRMLRADLAAEGHSAAEIDAEFSALTSAEAADPSWYLAWASAHRDPARTRAVLDAAVTRFPRDGLLHERRAVVAWAARDAAAARESADRAIALDPARVGAWFVLVAQATGEDALQRLRSFRVQFADSPSTLLDMGDAVAGSALGPDDVRLEEALAWTTGLRQTAPSLSAFVVTRARLLAATGDVPQALSELRALDSATASFAPAHKLEAELLASDGQFSAASREYDRYLALAPGDIAAARQRTRLDVWRGNRPAAERGYAALQTSYPGHAAIGTEAVAKAAAARGHWRKVLVASDRWLALEPDDVEAQMDRAQSLDRLGRPADAARALRDLSARQPSNPVTSEALRRLDSRSGLSLDTFAAGTSADGAARRQLLDLGDAGGGLAAGLGSYARVRLRAFGGASVARVPDQEWRGYLVGGQADVRLAPSVDANVAVTSRALDGFDRQWFGQARASWRWTDTLNISGGFERAMILENRYTLETGLYGQGPAVGVRYQPHEGRSLAVVAKQLTMSDGNVRGTFRADAAQRFGHGIHELRLVGASEWLSYRDPRGGYFSPHGFWRHDAGLEGRRWLTTPRFYGDRERYVSGAYLFGIDSSGERYHTARVGAEVEFAHGASVGAQVLAVRSRPYDGIQAFVGLRVRRVPEPAR